MIEHGGCPGSVKVATDAIGFTLMAMATGYIGFKNITYRGPSGNERHFNGFREENMIAFFINLFAAVHYFARVVANTRCSAGFIVFTHLRYADYLSTCPLLVLDLLWNLEAPYKCTCGGLILITIFTGVAASTSEPPESYLWFAYGDVIFLITYVTLVIIVRERMQFFVAHAKTNSALKAMYYIKFACCCFFLIWVWYPLLWIVSPYCLGLISMEVNDLLHMFLDVCAKSVYGIVLMWFRWNYDKKLLRNLDEQEFLAFSAKSEGDEQLEDAVAAAEAEAAARKAEESQDGRFRFAAKSDDGEGPFVFPDKNEEAQRRSPDLGFKNPNGLIQPFPVQSGRTSGMGGAGGVEDGRRSPMGTGSRQLFASNRRQSHSAESSPRRGAMPSSPVPRMRPEIRETNMDRWLAELGVFLEDHGLSNPQVVARALAALDQSGVTEEQLRTCVTDEDLEDMGIDTAARRLILGRYGRAGPVSFGARYLSAVEGAHGGAGAGGGGPQPCPGSPTHRSSPTLRTLWSAPAI